MINDPVAVHIGGSRATVLASDHHAARLVFQNASEYGSVVLTCSGFMNVAKTRWTNSAGLGSDERSGTVNAGVCERYLPGFKSPNACDLIAASPFPDSE